MVAARLFLSGRMTGQGSHRRLSATIWSRLLFGATMGLPMVRE
jgi:hypothetical protein